MKKTYFITAFILCLFSPIAKSQVILQLLPCKEFNLTTDEIININLSSPVDEKIVDVTISCKNKENAEMVFNGTLTSLKINSSITSISSKTSGLIIQYQSNSSNFNNSKILKAGTYQLCVSIKIHNNAEEIAAECEDYRNFPMNPPMLLMPDDGSNVNTLFPILNWIPPTPVLDAKNINYQLNLVQLRDHQNQFEAIASNSPILSTIIKSNTNLIYPMSAMPLAYGNSYAWQVEALEGNVSLGKTEVWKFKVQKDSLEELKEKYRLNSFISINEKASNSIFISNQDIKIQISGIDVDSTVFNIYTINDKLVSKIEHSSILILNDNKMVIMSENLVSLKKGEVYKMIATYQKRNYNFVFKFEPQL